jgi:hypothetical protein
MEQMEQQEQMRPPLTEKQLIQKLVGAKKVMDIVDGGEYTEGNIEMSKFTAPETPTSIPNDTSKNIQYPQNPALNEERIRQSKLPDAIKEAMINNPIYQPNIDATQQMDMKIFKNAKRLMKEDNGSNKPIIKGQTPTKQHNSKQQSNFNTTYLIENLEPIIENVIRKVLDEKLTQILSAYNTGSVNENLAIKVGDSIFHGKITKVKNTK